MTVQSQTSFIGYDGPAAGPFPIPFRFLADADIRITKALADGTSQTLVLTTDYTLSGARQQNGGEAALVVALLADERIVIDRGNMQLTQLTDYRANDPFPEEAAEDIADRQTMLLQQGLLDGSARSLRLSPVDIDGDGAYQGNGNRISDISPAINPTDVPTLEQVTGLVSVPTGPFIQVGVGAVPRPVQDELRETFKLEQFGAPADGIGDDSDALAKAIAAGADRILLVAGKSYRFVGTQTISAPLEIVADGATVSLGAGLVAGDSAFLVNTSGFTWRGGTLTAAVRVTAIKAEPAGASIRGINIRGVNFSGFFYDVFAEGDSGLGHYVQDLNVTDCTGIAPVGINAGHFLAIYCDGVTFADNSVQGGYNTSVYGCQNCSNITIVGNRETGVVDTVSDVEAAIQIEGGVGGPSSDSFALVSGNSLKHDIWVSDANEVNVTGNVCRRLRLSVGNPGTTGTYRNQYVGNKVAQIICQAFGTPGASDMTADFIGNQISAAGRTVNGVAINTSIYVDGPQALTIRFIGNRVMSDAATFACAIARDASMRLYFFDNEFGDRPHSLTSSGGVVYEKNNRNPLFSADCGYVSATPTADITMALGSFTGMALGTEQVDANAELTAATGTFTPLETGTYRFKGGVLFNVLAAGDDVGLRLFRTSGSPAELRRIGYMQPGAAGFCFLPFCTDLRLTAGDAVQLQYFHSAGAAGTILAGATLTQLQITREA